MLTTAPTMITGSFETTPASIAPVRSAGPRKPKSGSNGRSPRNCGVPIIRSSLPFPCVASAVALDETVHQPDVPSRLARCANYSGIADDRARCRASRPSFKLGDELQEHVHLHFIVTSGDSTPGPMDRAQGIRSRSPWWRQFRGKFLDYLSTAFKPETARGRQKSLTELLAPPRHP